MHEVRDLRNGDWYWIQKTVMQEYASTVGAMGILVYNFLASFADRAQRCFPSQKYIADSLGCSQSTVSRALKLLERCQLIRIERSRYHCVYHLLKVRYVTAAYQIRQGCIPDMSPAHTNKNKLTRIINNIESKNLLTEKATPKTREELVAFDIATILNDQKGYSAYLCFAHRYQESLLRRALGEVKEFPASKIKKSRAALFIHLVKKYAHETAHYIGN